MFWGVNTRVGGSREKGWRIISESWQPDLELPQFPCPSDDGNASIKTEGFLIRAKDLRLVICFLVDVLKPFP